MSRIVITFPDGSQQQATLPHSGVVRIGHNPACEVTLDDPQVRPVHCALKCADGRVVLVVPEGGGFVTLGDEPVTKRAMESGDELKIGRLRLSFVITDTDPNVGTTLAGYHVEARLGAGAMGTVYRAKQLSLDRPVALKLLSPSLTQDHKFVQGFLKEARNVARLNNPKVVQIYDAGQEDGRFYFSMEYLPGGTLESLLRGGQRVEVERALEIALDAAEALAWAEEQGIVHRDVKPANLLIADDGSVKLSDLGIAFDVSGATAEQQRRVGSPKYMAPEQAAGERVDHRADVYGLGATLFHLIAGRPPFKGRTHAEVLKQKLAHDAPRLSSVVRNVSPEVDDLVAKMLARSPSARFGSCAEMRAAVADVYGVLTGTGEQTDGVRGLASEASAPTSKRHNEAIVIGIASLIVVIAGFWAFSGGGDAPSPTPADSGGTATAGETGDGTSQPPLKGTTTPGAETELPSELADRLARMRQHTTGDGGDSPGNNGGSGASSSTLEDADLAVTRELGDIARVWRSGLIDDRSALRRIARFRERHPEPKYEADIRQVLTDIEKSVREKNEKRLQEELEKTIAPLIAASNFAEAETQLGELRDAFPDQTVTIERELQSLAEKASALWGEVSEAAATALNAGNFDVAEHILRPLTKSFPTVLQGEIEAKLAEITAAKTDYETAAAGFVGVEAEIQHAMALARFDEALKLAETLPQPSGDALSDRILKQRRALTVAETQLCADAWNRLERGVAELAKESSTVQLRLVGQSVDDGAPVKFKSVDGRFLVYVERDRTKRVPVLDLDSQVLENATKKAVADGGGETHPVEALGVLVLHTQGPHRAEGFLTNAAVLGAERQGEYLLRLKMDEAPWLKRTVGSLERRRDELRGAPGESASGKALERWRGLLEVTSRTIRATRSRPAYRGYRDRLAALFLDGHAALAGPDGLASLVNGKVKNKRNGLVEISYDFKEKSQLRDFHPVHRSSSSVSHYQKSARIRGEIRYLRGEPFRRRLTVTGLVPAKGYSLAAPNINIALWTHDDDRVSTIGSTISSSSSSSSSITTFFDDDGASPNDFMVFGIGYHYDTRGYLRVRGINNIVPMPAMAFLGGERGKRLSVYSSSQCVWARGVSSQVKGAQAFRIAVAPERISWQVNRKTIPIHKSDEYDRFDREEPYTGSITIFTNRQTVFYKMLTFEGELNPDWVGKELRRRAESDLRAIEPSFPFKSSRSRSR